MTTNRDDADRDDARARRGLPWRAGPWFLTQVDPDGHLSEPERDEVYDVGNRWAARTTTREIDGDLYAASWALVAALRERLAVDYREPLADVEPVDLNALVKGGGVYGSLYGRDDQSSRVPPLVGTAAVGSSVGTPDSPGADLHAAAHNLVRRRPR